MPKTKDRLEEFRPLIERALERTNGECTWDQLAHEVREGRAMLLPSKSGNSVAVLQVVHDLHVFTASGDMDELMQMEADVTDMARRQGFDRMTLIGRQGWTRVLGLRGWKPEQSLVKEL